MLKDLAFLLDDDLGAFDRPRCDGERQSAWESLRDHADELEVVCFGETKVSKNS